MREIKFRFWLDGTEYPEDNEDCGCKRMVSWDEVLNGTDGLAWFKDEILGGSQPMQYTGLKDRNGKEIYEGDIVNFHYFYGSLGGSGGFTEEEHELIGGISWGAFGWGVSAIKGEHWRGYTGFSDGEGESSIMDLMAMNESGVHEESFEVIGNIYENPELLEEGNGN